MQLEGIILFRGDVLGDGVIEVFLASKFKVADCGTPSGFKSGVHLREGFTATAPMIAPCERNLPPPSSVADGSRRGFYAVSLARSWKIHLAKLSPGAPFRKMPTRLWTTVHIAVIERTSKL